VIAAIYARKSTEQHVADDQKSVARQIAHAREYATRNGWVVDDAYVFADDGISGAEFTARPGYQQLLARLKPRPPFDVLIMSESSRLGREAWETGFALKLKQILVAGVRVFFYLKNRECTFDHPMDKLQFSIVQAFDEMERARASQRATDKALSQARAGHVTGGRVFGYDNVAIEGPHGQRSHVERRVNESEAPIVRRIFELAAAGVGQGRIAAAERGRRRDAASAARTAAGMGRVLRTRGPLPTALSRRARMEPHAQARSVGSEANYRSAE
jgi:DNA invertase Pin-like site-specific DNA recombinase